MLEHSCSEFKTILKNRTFPFNGSSFATLMGSFLFALILAGCTPKTWRDGPPPYDIDVNHIPDAQPKAEPLCKYGNKSYVVRGRRYKIMKSSHGYRATGTASWYGSRFHKRLTSSGEPFNMLAMTAAHPTLPLPTYLKVTNLHNHKMVVVKVNDRGPFRGNRLLDLSYAAAKKLGIHGTARVHIEAIDPNHYTIVKKTQIIKHERYTLDSVPSYRLEAQRRYAHCEAHLGLTPASSKTHADSGISKREHAKLQLLKISQIS